MLNLILDYKPAISYWLLVALSTVAWLLSFFVAGGKQSERISVPFREQWEALREKLKAIKPLLPGMIL
ncbi:major facilitator superfamily protein, partial [Paenibacillus alvei A6-6i-x]